MSVIVAPLLFKDEPAPVTLTVELEVIIVPPAFTVPPLETMTCAGLVPPALMTLLTDHNEFVPVTVASLPTRWRQKIRRTVWNPPGRRFQSAEFLPNRRPTSQSSNRNWRP